MAKLEDHYGYLHGYDRDEQDRLIRQARFFERHLFKGLRWPEGSTEILEPGCGVGAQTEVLCRRYPGLKITSLDRSEAQLGRARAYLQKQIAAGRVNLVHGSGEKLPFEDSRFHGAFVSWLLEHVPKPIELLQEVRRVLQPGSIVYCNEVLNSSYFLHPYSPATLQYWFAFNDHQWNMGGDPFCGAKLGNHLLDAGFQEVHTRVISIHLDKRGPKTRVEAMREQLALMMSAAPELIKAGLVTQKTVDDVQREWQDALENPEAILFYSVVQARGLAL